jgi:putative peptidoglycan lipid II flippase
MKPRGILKNAFTVGAFTALSRVLGLVREMMQSRLIGAGIAQSAFTIAFAIPNMARKLFGEGALTAAFVPIFKDEVENGSLENATRLARAVMTTVMLMLGAILVVAIGSLELVVKFRNELGIVDAKRFLLTIRLIKTLLPYMLFICGAAFGMGVLNALGRFKASSAMPCLLNICWIAMLGWISFFPEMRPDQRIHRIAVAILAAGALQMVFMLWMMARAGVVPGLKFSGWRDSKVVKVWRNIGIGALGAGAIQLNYLLDQLLAQLANPWAAGVIGYAERLMDLPLGVIGVAFGTVLLPTFAGLFAKKDLDGARDALGSSLISLSFVMIPAAVGLFVLSGEVTGVIYEGGEFDSLATLRVSRSLAVYSVGLGFFSLQKVMVPWFQAQSDMKTPLKVSLATVAMNAVLNIMAVLLLPVEWRHVGLAGSTVFCSLVGCLMLLALAKRRNSSLGLSRVCMPILKILVSSAVMGGAVWLTREFLFSEGASLENRMNHVLELGVLIAAGGAVYFVSSFLFMRKELKAMRMKRRA